MHINKWRLFWIHYGAVFTVWLLWTFTITHHFLPSGKDVNWQHWIIFIKPLIVKVLFLGKDAPVLNALLLTLISTYFYLFIFQDLVQKQFKRFAIKFCLFVGALIILQIILWAFYDWLLFNYTYEYEKEQAWIETQKENGNLFRPFSALLLDSFHILTQNRFVYGLLVLGVDDIILYLLYTAFFTLVMYVWQNRKREEALEKQQREVEIQSLKAQLNPHFLFNSLNTIYSSALSEKDTPTAQLVQQISGILRHSVEEIRHEKTSLEKELAFIEKYLALQRARLPQHPHLSINTSIHWDQEPADIAPLLLIPFLENAFQYGISLDQPSFVVIRLEIEDKKLHLRVENSLLTVPSHQKGAGTGLPNVQKRLQLLYPHQHTLVFGPEKSTFLVDLTLQL